MIGFNKNNISFTDWMRYCDELKDEDIRIEYQEIKNLCNNKNIFHQEITPRCDSDELSKSELHESIAKSEKLFVHNQITYFGNRNLMYQSNQWKC